MTLDGVEPADAGVSQPVSGCGLGAGRGLPGTVGPLAGRGRAGPPLVSGDEEVRAAMPVEVAVGVAVELGLG